MNLATHNARKPRSVHFSSERHTWGTPDFMFRALDAEFDFTLDACALPENAKCSRYFSPSDNSLIQSWRGERVFMNPPYGREIGLWMRKAMQESFLQGALVVCLVPARTDTAWWHDYARNGEIRYLRGRLQFEGAKDGAPFPSAVVIFRPGCSVVDGSPAVTSASNNQNQ